VSSYLSDRGVAACRFVLPLDIVYLSILLMDNTQYSHAPWKVLDFSPKISRTWKALKNEFGPGKS